MRDGTNEREDDVLGPRHETTLRLGDRIFVRNANGNVRELRGYLHRRALTEDLLDSGAFAAHPELARFAGWGDVERRARLAARSARCRRRAGDAVDRLRQRPAAAAGISRRRRPVVRRVRRLARGRRSQDSVSLRCSPTATAVSTRCSRRRRCAIDQPVDPAAFAPLKPRLLATDRVHTVPLVEREGHVGVTVQCAGRDWFFLLDTGAQSILVDTSGPQSRRHRAARRARSARRDAQRRSRRRGPAVACDRRRARLDDVVVSSLDI